MEHRTLPFALFAPFIRKLRSPDFEARNAVGDCPRGSLLCHNGGIIDQHDRGSAQQHVRSSASLFEL